MDLWSFFMLVIKVYSCVLMWILEPLFLDEVNMKSWIKPYDLYFKLFFFFFLLTSILRFCSVSAKHKTLWFPYHKSCWHLSCFHVLLTFCWQFSDISSWFMSLVKKKFASLQTQLSLTNFTCHSLILSLSID